MTAFTMQLSTRLRTWALVAGLTGLLTTLGALIGGSFLWLFVALAVAMNLAGYYYSDRLALRAAHAQPVSTAEAPELFVIARDLSDRAGIPLPELYVMPGEEANAFATGRDPEHAAVAMTHGLLTDLNPNQVHGVLAHELAHVKNRDILVSSIAAMVAGAISAVASILQLSFLFGGQDEDSLLSSLGSLTAIVLAPIGAVLLQMGISRRREYLADATAADLLRTGAPLADALETSRASNCPALDVSPATASIYIINPLSSQALTNLGSTHPPVPERVRRLRAYRQPVGAAPARRRTGLRAPDGWLAATH